MLIILKFDPAIKLEISNQYEMLKSQFKSI